MSTCTFTWKNGAACVLERGHKKNHKAEENAPRPPDPEALERWAPPVVAGQLAERVAAAHLARQNAIKRAAMDVDDSVVHNETDRAELQDKVAALKADVEAYEQERTRVSSPWRKIGEALSSVFAPTVKEGQEAVRRGKEKILAWQRDEQRRRDAELEATRKAEDEAAAKGYIVKPRVAPAVVETATRTAASTSSTSRRWKHRVVAPELVPREFCSPDDALIKGRMTSDVQILGAPRDVPGVEFYQDENLAIGGAGARARA